MKQSDAGFCRRAVHSYLEYLDLHGSVASRLCASGARTTIVYCDESKVGLSDQERRELEACPNVDLVEVADSGHMVMAAQPTRTAELIVELVSAEAKA